jgi:hypothetical protein
VFEIIRYFVFEIIRYFVYVIILYFSLEQCVTFCLILGPATKGQYMDLQPSASQTVFLYVGSLYLLSAPMPLY